MSCGHLAAGGSAQVRPVDVGAQVFAADSAIGCALDRWAVFSRHPPLTTGPLTDEHWVGANRFCDVRLPFSAREEIVMQVHARNLAPRYRLSNSAAGIEPALADCYPSVVTTPPSARNEMRRKALLELIKQCVPSRFETQREMAEALGFVPAHFSQMKSGNRPVGNESADRIERGLGLPVGSLDREPEPGTDLSPSSNTTPQQSEVIFTPDNVVAPSFDEPRRWPFSPAIHERIMTLGAEEVSELESALEHQLGLIEARLSRAATTGTKQSKRAS